MTLSLRQWIILLVLIVGFRVAACSSETMAPAIRLAGTGGLFTGGIDSAATGYRQYDRRRLRSGQRRSYVEVEAPWALRPGHNPLADLVDHEAGIRRLPVARRADVGADAGRRSGRGSGPHLSRRRWRSAQARPVRLSGSGSGSQPDRQVCLPNSNSGSDSQPDRAVVAESERLDDERRDPPDEVTPPIHAW
ncbi:hypothetical protein AAFF_G00150190 [Aldrovandia affinis]|uniref:Secreted protein n=1 Tax=Aldrovandia affinis TaxID=143900 RepID=A0AAD7VWD0_9TELE|nr:hypothetical protein AAFF_G00150190 [Aldrovandia affinis]